MGAQEPAFPLKVIYEDCAMSEHVALQRPWRQPKGRNRMVELKHIDQVALYCDFDPWFDSEEEEENRRRGIVKVVDKFGRRVRLRVEHLDVLVCELAES